MLNTRQYDHCAPPFLVLKNQVLVYTNALPASSLATTLIVAICRLSASRLFVRMKYSALVIWAQVYVTRDVIKGSLLVY